MKFLRLLKGELRLALSWQVLVCGLLGLLIRALGTAGEALGNSSVWYLLIQSEGFGTIGYITLFILPVLPFAMSLAQDLNGHAAYGIVSRSGVAAYMASKWIACAASGFVTVFIGMTLFTLLYHLFFPIYSNSVITYTYEDLMEKGYVWRGVFGYILHMSLSGSLTAVFGMFVSTFFTSEYVAVAAPISCNVLLGRLVLPLHLTGVWNPDSWVMSVHSAAGAGWNLLEKLVMVLLFCLLMGIVGFGRIRRRIENG